MFPIAPPVHETMQHWQANQTTIPNLEQPSKWNTITDPNLMDQNLLEYCQNHFSNSHSTPFTVPPLPTLLKYDGLTPFGTEVLQGTADLESLDINQSTQLLFQHQKSCTPDNIPCFQKMPYNELMQGFQKWKEHTTTSPSGWHLELYKALLKDDHCPKKKKTNPTAKSPPQQRLSAQPQPLKHWNKMDRMSCR